MTALCPGGGPSSPKFGHAAVVEYSAGLLAAIFAVYDLAYLIPIIPFLGIAPLVLTTFCGTDPPAAVALTSAEASAILNLTFGTDFNNGLQKVVNIALNGIWYDACQCNSGTPTPFVPPPAPAGTPILQPPSELPSTAVPCQRTAEHNTNVFATFYPQFVVFNNPGGATGVNWTFGTRDTDGGIHATVTRFLTWRDGGGVTLATSATYTTSAPGSTTVFIAAPTGWATVAEQINVTANPTSHDLEFSQKDFYCGGQMPGGTLVPCCPPDVATQAQLQIILEMVTLIQRQIVPFAYIRRTQHTNLSGAGDFAVQGLLGVQVLPALSSFVGHEMGDPTEYFDMGWITWGNADGWKPRQFITHSPFVSLPEFAGQYTRLGYSLAPGVVATITELVREP